MLKRKRLLILIIIFATLIPNMALAHGVEVLFLPLGQVIAVVVVILLWPLRQGVFLLALFFAVGVALALWFIPDSWFPESLRGPTGQFFSGFVPPLAAVGLIIFIFHGFWCRNKKDT